MIGSNISEPFPHHAPSLCLLLPHCRKRLAAAGRIDVADDELDEGDTLFAPFRRQLAEQETAQAKAKIKAVDPGVNIAADFGEQWGGGGFGSLHGGAEGSRAQSSKPSTALDSIARELNRHAAQVLDGTPAGLEGGEGSDEGTAAIAARVAAAVQAQSKAKGGAAAKNQAEADAALAKEWQARAVSGLEDLSLHAAPDVVPLHIQDPRAYFGGSGADAQPAHGLPDTDKSAEADGFVKNKAAVSDMLQRIHARALANPPCDTAAAAAALLEVGRDEDETLVAEFGEVASMAMGTAPEKALGSVMVVSLSGDNTLQCQNVNYINIFSRTVLLRVFWKPAVCARGCVGRGSMGMQLQFSTATLFAGFFRAGVLSPGGAEDQRDAAPFLGVPAAGVGGATRQSSAPGASLRGPEEQVNNQKLLFNISSEHRDIPWRPHEPSCLVLDHEASLLRHKVA